MAGVLLINLVDDRGRPADDDGRLVNTFSDKNWVQHTKLREGLILELSLINLTRGQKLSTRTALG